MDLEFSDLIPVFVEEARDRIDRLATHVSSLDEDGESMAIAKRELHTLKGSARMLQIDSMAQLCHAAEEALVGEASPGRHALLTRAVDRLAEMLESVAAGDEPEVSEELHDELLAAGGQPAAGEPEAEESAPDGSASAQSEVDKSAPDEAAAGGDVAVEEESPADDAEPAVAASAALDPGADDDGEMRIDVDMPVASGAGAGLSQQEPGAAAAEAPGPAAPASLAASEIRVEASALDEVADRATQLRLMSMAAARVGDRMYDLAQLAEDGLREPQPKQVLAVLSAMLRRMAVELEGDQRLMLRSADTQLDQVLTLQLQPLRGPLLKMARYARQIAASLDHEVEVELEGQETKLDRRIARDLEDAFLHLVRNAVDHGLESPEARQAAGKPRAGRLRFAASTSGSRVRLEIRDDGPGIDPDEIRDKAVSMGLVERSTADAMSRVQVFRLLFTPGFSTRVNVSEISGRGVGLDVVAAAVTRVGGEVFLRSEPGQGTLVAVEVPVARRGEQVMVLKVGQSRIALPSAVVRGATEISEDDVVERDGGLLAKVGDRLVAFVSLAQVYGEAPAATQLLLEGSVSGQRLAIAVDDVEVEEEVLVRSLPSVASSDRLLEGMALLSTGYPVGVLSPSALARRDLLRSRPRAQPVAVPERVRVLLVDDSLVTREMERRLLEDAGFHVVAAGDADEAMGRLGEESFDCIVTDIEMPGMNGFELTEHLRSMEHFAQLPIVVVSTRDRPEDRLRGLRAGADAYLTKQSLDAGELVDLVHRLAGR